METKDNALIELAERSANALLELAPNLSGHPPWPAQADAVLATVALFRDDREQAASFAISAQQRTMSAMQEDLHLTILLPVARVLRDVGAPEAEPVLGYVHYAAGMIAQRTLDESIRVRWFRGPLGRALTELIGSNDMGADAVPEAGGNGKGPDHADRALLRSLVQGRTNAEIAQDLGVDEAAVVRRLGELFAKIGASSRAEATAFAFRERVV
jgi:DNA-binding CsgD family transcriptional regulator